MLLRTMADERRREESVVQVPSRGGGEPPESKEPQLPPGPNPELADKGKGTELVRGADVGDWARASERARMMRGGAAFVAAFAARRKCALARALHGAGHSLLGRRAAPLRGRHAYAGHHPRARAQSAEDRELKERLLLAVERLRDPVPELVKAALELLRKELREATSSMTSVPKPMKFLGPHLAALKSAFEVMPPGDNRCACDNPRRSGCARRASASAAFVAARTQ